MSASRNGCARVPPWARYASAAVPPAVTSSESHGLLVALDLVVVATFRGLAVVRSCRAVAQSRDAVQKSGARASVVNSAKYGSCRRGDS